MRETRSFFPYRACLMNGSNKDIRVDGSETPVVFSLGSDSSADIAITEVRVVLFGAGLYGVPGFRQFTDTYGSGLTNGLKLTFTRDSSMEWFINPIKKIGDFFNFHDDAYEIEALIPPTVDELVVLFKFYSQPIWLLKGTDDKIEFTVQDDLTCLYDGLESIVHATGFKEVT